MSTKKLGLTQYIPEGLTAAFTAVDPCPGANYWHAKIRDAIHGDEPEFRLRIPKKSKKPVTAQRFANAVAGELNEARGTIFVTKYEDGVPTLSAAYVSNGWQVLCFWSTDWEQAPVEHPCFTKGKTP